MPCTCHTHRALDGCMSRHGEFRRHRTSPLTPFSLPTKRVWSLKCSAAPPAPEEPAKPAESPIAERIRRAKEYKQQRQAPASSTAEQSCEGQAQSLAVPLTEADSAVLDEFNRNLAQYGEDAAARQQGTFISALEEAKSQANALETGLPEQEALQQRQRQEDYIKKNAKHISPTLHAKLKSGSARADTFSRSRDADDRGAGPLGGPTTEELERRKSAMSGSEEAAATYLAQVAQTKSEAAGLRPEMFTIYKEEEMKARGVEMITRDRTYDPQKEPPVKPAEYKPKVSTWGVFPRPPDISKAYGGGRTISPETAQDSEARAKERDERLKATILEYRKRQGLFIDPEEEAKWMASYQAGLELMQRGQLQGAAQCFERVAKAVPQRSKLGGEAQLQRAICLDSVGRNDEAYKIYMTLERHPIPEIQKGAKKMIFGFRAAENLKTKTMTYSASSQDWETYFTRFQGEWNTGYVPDMEQGDYSVYTYIAAAVILTPLILLAYLIIR